MHCPEKLEYDSEFYRRIRHDFKKYLLLKTNGTHLNEEVILQTIYKMEGYKHHKKVNYGEHTSHIIVMFIDVYAALEAIARLNLMTRGLTTILVDDMLRSWFTYEKKTCQHGPPYSLTIVDIIGNPPLNLNFLTSHILSTIFQDFGAPYLLPYYTAALNEPHMQVLFSSMTEALAACMAFGEWYRMEEKADCFFYRVRINPSNMEEKLIKNCGGKASEAFELSYFIKFKNEAKSGRMKDSVAKEKESRPKASTTERFPNMHTQDCPLDHGSKFRQTNPFGHGTPIIYVPLIPTNPYNAHASVNSQFGAGFTSKLNFQQTFSAQSTATMANPEFAKNATRQYKSSEEIPEYTDDKNSEHESNASQNNSNSNFQCHIRGPIRTRGNQRRMPRVFERSR